MLNDLPLIDLAEGEVLDTAVEEMASHKNVPHGVVHGPEEDIGEILVSGQPALINHLFHQLEQLLPVIRQVKVLELVDNQEKLLVAVLSQTVRES